MTDLSDVDKNVIYGKPHKMSDADFIGGRSPNIYDMSNGLPVIWNAKDSIKLDGEFLFTYGDELPLKDVSKITIYKSDVLQNLDELYCRVPIVARTIAVFDAISDPLKIADGLYANDNTSGATVMNRDGIISRLDTRRGYISWGQNYNVGNNVYIPLQNDGSIILYYGASLWKKATLCGQLKVWPDGTIERKLLGVWFLRTKRTYRRYCHRGGCGYFPDEKGDATACPKGHTDIYYRRYTETTLVPEPMAVEKAKKHFGRKAMRLKNKEFVQKVHREYANKTTTDRGVVDSWLKLLDYFAPKTPVPVQPTQPEIINAAENSEQSPKRKRGRPKGSKNKPKVKENEKPETNVL